MKTRDYFLRAVLTLMTAAGLLVGVGQMQAQFGPQRNTYQKGHGRIRVFRRISELTWWLPR